MNTVYILLGSNEGDRLQHLANALTRIQQTAGILVKQSNVYVTHAWGNTEQPDFLNQAICVKTVLSPHQLLTQLLDVEKEMGRIRKGTKWLQRIIDLDILFYDELILQEETLCIPHPFIQDRKFVLIPMLEIAAEFMHPVFKKSIAALTAECKDMLEVKKLLVV